MMSKLNEFMKIIKIQLYNYLHMSCMQELALRQAPPICMHPIIQNAIKLRSYKMAPPKYDIQSILKITI